MNDYLSRAADRASAIGSTVRPVLPSLFDSDKIPADSVMREPKFPEAQPHLEAKDRSSVEEKSASIVSKVQGRVASVLALAPETPAVTQTHKGDPITKPRLADVPPGGAVSQAEQALEVNASSTGSKVGSEKSSSPERSDIRPRLARSSPVAERSAEPKESAPDSRATRPYEGVEPSDELPSKQPESIRPKVIEPANSNLPPVIPVIAVPRQPAASLMPTQTRNKVRSVDRESSSKQTIQVTIGRLEVRAVQSAPGLPKPAPPSPRISLEEYLRSRNRGNR